VITLTGHFCERYSLKMNTLQKHVFIRQAASQIEKFPDVVCATGE
jgi:hypothetical protein